MNVAPGVYSIETGINHRILGKPIAGGPRVSITVAEDKSFVGRAFVSPTMQLVAPAERLLPTGSGR